MTTLLSAIAASTGPHEFPARIDTTAVALSELAAARLSPDFQGAKLRRICEALRQIDVDVIDGRCGPFTADDIKVIAFFLARNKSVHTFQCVVRPARCSQPEPQHAARQRVTSGLERKLRRQACRVTLAYGMTRSLAGWAGTRSATSALRR